MKKMIFSLMLSFCSILSLSAMDYAEAREQARFLTDKMAYELNLNDQQYNDCYEINLDYLLSVDTEYDLYGDYLAYRNSDIRHILYDWQYALFTAADYFFRPLAWLNGAWYYPIYRYYRPSFYYYSLPAVFHSYRGGHGRHYYHSGFYISRRPHHWNGGFRGMDRGAIVHRSTPSHRGFNHRGGPGSVSGHRSPGYSFSRGGRSGSPSHSNHPSYSISRGSSEISGRGARSDNGRGYGHPSSTRSTVAAPSNHPSHVSAPHSSHMGSSRPNVSHSSSMSSHGSRGGSFGGASRGGSMGTRAGASVSRGGSGSSRGRR